MHAAVEGRLTAIGAARTRTVDAMKAAEQRADDAEQRANEATMRAEEAEQQLASAQARAETAEQSAQAAIERAREIEKRGGAPKRSAADKEIELSPLIDATPSPPSELTGKRATRHTFSAKAKVQIDRDVCTLADLSVTGAQVLGDTPPEVGRIVNVTFLSDDAPCFCQGRLLWSRREQVGKSKNFRYRTGIVFTSADEAAIIAYIERHALEN